MRVIVHISKSYHNHKYVREIVQNKIMEKLDATLIVCNQHTKSILGLKLPHLSYVVAKDGDNTDIPEWDGEFQHLSFATVLERKQKIAKEYTMYKDEKREEDALIYYMVKVKPITGMLVWSEGLHSKRLIQHGMHMGIPGLAINSNPRLTKRWAVKVEKKYWYKRSRYFLEELD